MLHDWIRIAPREGLEEGIYDIGIDPLRHPPGLSPDFYSQSPPRAQPKPRLQARDVEGLQEHSPGEPVRGRSRLREFVEMLWLLAMDKGLRAASDSSPALQGLSPEFL